MSIQGQFPSVIQLSGLNGDNGFELDGANPYDRSGISVNNAGDVNGDGVNDIIIGAPGHSSAAFGETGKTHVVFGKNAGWKSPLSLSNLDDKDGFQLESVFPYDYSGISVSNEGDVNGDGVDDIIIGATSVGNRAVSHAGKTYVIFGKRTGWMSTTPLENLDGSTGFELIGSGDEYSGNAVSSVGDINGDGIQDIIIGASQANGVVSFAGKTYVVFGRSTWGSPIFLSSLNGTDGFVLTGAVPGYSGYSVSTAGDINNDGINDIIIGAESAAVGEVNQAGIVYVIFGKRSWTGPISLSSLNGSNGFELDGVNWGDLTGTSVNSAGDVNGDGISDIIMGAVNANSGGLSGVGKVYVVFGKSFWTTPISLAKLDGSNGFELDGMASGGACGQSVSTAGDINNDGINDIIIGCPNYSGGKIYVVFGKPNWTSPISLSTLNGFSGFELQGMSDGDYSGNSVSAAGDINSDGINDIVIGASLASPGHLFNAGKTYVVFGGSPHSLVLLQNNLQIYGGETLRLTSQHLNATYFKNPGNLVFTVRNIKHGYFEYVNNPAIKITSFNQQALWDGQIQVVHDGTRIPLSYEVQVNSDTFVYISPQNANVSFTIAIPSFINNQLSIARGQTVYVTSTYLQAYEPGFNDDNLVFLVSDINHGQFINYLGKSIFNFTQHLVSGGAIRFMHDNSASPPRYNVAISDGHITTDAKAAIVNFNPSTNTTITAPNNTIRNALISGSVSGAVGLGFFAFKLYIERQAAKNLKKALEGDGSETERDQIEFHNHVIRPIAKHLFEHIKTTGCLGSRNEQKTKAYVMALETIVGRIAEQGINVDLKTMKSSKRILLINEIIRQIKRHSIQRNFFTQYINCKPDITPSVLEEKIDEIVARVCAALPPGFSRDLVRSGEDHVGNQFEMAEMQNEERKDEEKVPFSQPLEMRSINEGKQGSEEEPDAAYRLLP